MDLWIRSQKKGQMVLSKNIYIYETNDGFVITDTNALDDLGIYKSKERALEVLDEIQKLLTGSSRIILQPKIMVDDKKEKLAKKEAANGVCCIPVEFDYSVINQSVVVYEMPKE